MTAAYQPADWLQALARVRPVRWPTDHVLSWLWVSTGALTTAAGEGDGTYRAASSGHAPSPTVGDRFLRPIADEAERLGRRLETAREAGSGRRASEAAA